MFVLQALQRSPSHPVDLAVFPQSSEQLYKQDDDMETLSLSPELTGLLVEIRSQTRVAYRHDR
jgi:hypothetical protein